MKKFIPLLLIFALLFSLIGCKEETYEPVPSTDEEARVMFRLRYEGSNFDVRYELYRAFYLNLRQNYPDGPLSEEDASALEEDILFRIYHLHAMLALCNSTGNNVYSASVEDKIQSFIKVSVEGGLLDSTEIEGYGSYEKYLESLKALNLNYASQVLIFRYGIAKSLVDEYYRSKDGIYTSITKEDVEAFYQQADTGRYLTLYLASDNFSKERAEEIAQSIALQSGEDAVFAKMVNYSSMNLQTLRSGQIITKNNLDALTYTNLTAAALSLNVGEVSAPIPVYNSQTDGYIILYKAEKSDEHFEENYETILEEYVNDQAGIALRGVHEKMKESVTFYPLYETLDRESIHMQ